MADKKPQRQRQQAIDPTVADMMASDRRTKPDREESPPIRLRKKRKDATGQKPDYHVGTVALSVRVPEETAEQVKARAAQAGQSVNAWLADLIQAALDE